MAKSKLKLVKPPLDDERRKQLIIDINAGTSTKELEDEYGLTRQQVRTLQAKHKITLPSRAKLTPVSNPQAPKPPPAPVKPPFIQIALATVIILISLTLGGVGLVLNWQFAVTLGQTPLSSNLLGMLGASIDLVTIFIMAVASLLWDQKRWGQFILAIGIGLLCFALSTIAAMSFAASNVGDSLQGREAVANHRNALIDQLNRSKSDRMRITEYRDPQAIEQQIQIEQGKVPASNWRTSDHCTNVTWSGRECLMLNQERAAKGFADQRIKLDAKISEFSTRIAELPPVAVKDPGASQISRLTYGYAGTEEVESFRLIGFAFMPSLAGFMLAFARTLLR